MNEARLSSGRDFVLLGVLVIAGCDRVGSPIAPVGPSAQRTQQAEVVPAILWTHQFGTAADDVARAISVDGAAVYVAGQTEGIFPGQTSAGGTDAFVRKLDLEGNELWTRQFGTSAFDVARGIAVDGTGVYVAGETGGVLPGHARLGDGESDAFVRKYDFDGNVIWTRQFGSNASDGAWGIAVDGSGVFVVGQTDCEFGLSGFQDVRLPPSWPECDPDPEPFPRGTDLFVRKYDVDGDVIWTRQFGDRVVNVAGAISVHAGGVYVAGGDLGPFRDPHVVTNALVRSYDAEGNVIWGSHFPGDAPASDIAVDASGVYVAAGFDTWVGNVAYLRKLDRNGHEIWARSLENADGNVALATSVDGMGVYVVESFGILLRRYDADGNEVWAHEYATGFHETHALSLDRTGAYLAGQTIGPLPGQTGAGGWDAFVLKLSHPDVTLDPPIRVTIMIKPGEGPNSINPRSQGRLAVAILSTTAFDAATVMPATVRFGRSGTEAAPVHAALEDVDGDGVDDLVLHFQTRQTGIRCEDASASLTGETTGGEMFEGSDSINTVGCR